MGVRVSIRPPVVESWARQVTRAASQLTAVPGDLDEILGVAEDGGAGDLAGSWALAALLGMTASAVVEVSGRMAEAAGKLTSTGRTYEATDNVLLRDITAAVPGGGSSSWL